MNDSTRRKRLFVVLTVVVFTFLVAATAAETDPPPPDADDLFPPDRVLGEPPKPPATAGTGYDILAVPPAASVAGAMGVSATCNGEIPAVECAALAALYNSTNGPGWTNNTGWETTDTPCSKPWHGVTCSGGHVSELNLINNNLSGNIPPELGNLSNLQKLTLLGDELSGSIPPQLGTLANLDYLSLTFNDLGGSIPPELGSLSNLKLLSLSGNELSGSIPPELGDLSNLEFLFLSENQLSGTIPLELTDLPNLTHLSLSYNQLGGTIPPELSNLSNLRYLYLHDNQLSGTIPPELATLSNLRHLELYNNQLTGSIPPQLGDLSNLQYLLLGYNQLTGSIPPQLGDLSDLELLDLSGNQLTGSIPPQLGDLSTLRGLSLDRNQLSGSIPPQLGDLSNLQSLNLFENQLSGSIPPELGDLSNLRDLSLECNQLSGSIPAELSNCASPGCGSLADLGQLLRQSNALEGDVPAEFTSLSSLYYTDVRYNMLTFSDPVLDFLNNLDSPFGDPPCWDTDCADTQTVPPGGVEVVGTTGSSAILSWIAIPYTGDGGYYQVGAASSSGGPYQPVCQTTDKTDTDCTVVAGRNATDLYLAVRTYTPAHSGQQTNEEEFPCTEQQNDLWSAYSEEVMVTLTPDLLAIGEVEIDVSGAPDQVVARVGGYLPDSCTRLDAVEQSREPLSSATVNLELTTWRTPTVTCAQRVRAVGIDVTLMGSYPPGSYTLTANGEDYPFTVP